MRRERRDLTDEEWDTLVDRLVDHLMPQVTTEADRYGLSDCASLTAHGLALLRLHDLIHKTEEEHA